MPVRLNGSTSGYVELAAPATAGTTSLTLPTDSVQPGLVLVSPTSLTVSGGSASASGGQITFTNITSLSLNGIFPSTYDNFRVVINITGISVAGESFYMRMRTGGTDSAVSYLNTRVYGSGSGVSSDQPSTTAIWAGYSYTAAPAAAISITEIQRPSVAEWTKYYNFSFWSNGTGSAYTVSSAGVHQVATAYDSMTIYPASGNISGIVRVYGYRNSLTT